MDKVQPTQSADWVTITTRWVFLVGITLWLALGIGFTLPIIILLILGGIVNILFSVAHAIDRNIPGDRIISLFVDVLIVSTIFYLTVPMGAEMGWIGLLPLITAAVYFYWVGAVILIVINMLIQGAIAWIFAPPENVIFFLGTLFALYLIIGFGMAYVSRRWLSGTRTGRRKKRRKSVNSSDSMDSERRQAIYELISEMSASLSYQRTLDTALSLSTNSLAELEAPVDDLVSMVLFFADSQIDGTSLQIVTSRLLLPADTRLVLPGVSGLIGHTIEEGVAEISKNVSTDPELSKFVSLRNYHSAYCIPLRSGLEAYGVMLFAHPKSDFFSSDRREVLDIIAKQFTVAIQNARLYQDLELEKERMMSIQEDARRKMARDLHDGPTQSVAAIAMRVNFARRLMEKDPNSAAEELYKIEELARRTTKEIRHMLFTLRPLVLESQGLIAALEAMADKMDDTYDQNVVVEVDSDIVDALEPGKQAVIFYLAEEAVNNARKHAKAKHIWITLRPIRKGVALLEIKDDGLGFEVKKVEEAYEERGSLGMINMKERTELINGVLHIDSAVGRGTRVRIAIPLTDEATDLLRRGM